MRVAIHAPLDPRTAGGVQTNAVALVGNLARFSDELGVDILVPDRLGDVWRAAVPASCVVRPWPHSPSWYREGQRRSFLARGRRLYEFVTRAEQSERDSALRSYDVQMLHFPYQLAFDTQLPSIYEPWDLQHVHLPHFFTQDERTWRDQMYGRACRRAALVVTATSATKKDLIDHFGIPARRIAVVRRDSNMAGPAHQRLERQRILARHGLPETFAFFPARTYPHKNHLRLLEALAIIRDRNAVKLPLVCCGRIFDAHWPEIESAIQAHGLQDQVRFLGSVDEDELAALYAEATLLVFPSRYEGLGLPLLEAMQFGLPIVAGRASCIPEVAGDACVLFDPTSPVDIADVLLRVWNDEDLRRTLAIKGSQRRPMFSWPKAAATFLAAYRKIAGLPLSREADALLSAAIES